MGMPVHSPPCSLFVAPAIYFIFFHAAIKVWNVECEMPAADVRDERRKGVGNGRDENRRMKNERHRKEKKDFY